MLTLFSIPKKFEGHIKIIQRNAIQSWTLLNPRPRIILFGNDEGTSEVAAEMHLEHVPDVSCTEYGTPLIQSVFQKARSISTDPFLCYLNADIMLTSDFLPALNRVSQFRNRFLMAGQRWDLDVTEPIDFSEGWEKKIRDRIRNEGKLHEIWGMDYFIFSKDVGSDMPPFAIGRPCWDNWFIYSARKKGYPVVDATSGVTVVHQNHDYRHVPLGTGKSYHGPEAEKNREMAGEFASQFSLIDATHHLTAGKVNRNFERKHLIRELDTLPTLHPAMTPVVAGIRFALRLTKPFRSSSGTAKKATNA
jgi:hypothetical protein